MVKIRTARGVDGSGGGSIVSPYITFVRDISGSASTAAAGRVLLVFALLFVSVWQSAHLFSLLSDGDFVKGHDWHQQPLLSARGLPLEIPTLDAEEDGSQNDKPKSNKKIRKKKKAQFSTDSETTTVIVTGMKHEVTLVVHAGEQHKEDNTKEQSENSSNSKTILASEGSVGLLHMIEELQFSKQCIDNPKLLLVEVGGLKGDFGIAVAAETNCRTVIYEAQKPHAIMMAQSILLPENNLHPIVLSRTVKIRNAAVSRKKWVSFPGHKDKIPTEQLDTEFEHESILLLKVDVEGGEDEVLRTGLHLFLEKKVHHVVLEYTPHHFSGRGTDYSTLLSRLDEVGVRACYALHRNEPLLYRIPPDQYDLFYTTLRDSETQTDIYCTFVQEGVDTFASASDWTPDTSL